MTLAELVEAYKSGKLTDDDILWLDNDTTGLYTGDEDAGEPVVKVFEMHPYELLEQALDLLGVLYDHV
jgi:hypothetical protein